ncbi:MAG: hypothetical protein AMXMBFR25_26950 [Lysobacterales bacterium]
MKHTPRAPKHRALTAAVTLALAVGAMPALAFEYTNGDFSLTTSNTLSYGVQSRIEKIDEKLIGKVNLFTPILVPPPGTSVLFPAQLSNAQQRLLPGRFSVNSDDGNRKWERGDVFSNAIKWTGELSWQYAESFGGFMRATSFYDFENQRRDDISDLAKKKVGKDTQLLDFFVYGNYDVGESMSGSVRLGRQVVSWGESTFIQQGINVVNPVDLSKLRVAGSELKEAFLPIDMLWSSFSFNENFSMEALYMLEFENTEPEPSGTYFSSNDFTALGGEYVMLNFGLVPEPIDLASCSAILAGQNPLGLDAATLSAQRLGACAAAVPRAPDRYASESGQYGVALRYFSPELNNTEFGLFFLNYHSRLPLLSGISVTSSAANSARYFAEYPEDIELYGFSFNTTLEGSGIALQGEISYRPNVPLQVDDVELLFTALSPLNNLIPQPVNRFISQLGVVGPGQYVKGWERHELSQFQFTATKVFGPENWIAADQISAVLEMGFTKVWDLPDHATLRYQGDGTDTGGGPDFLTGAFRNPQTLTEGFPTSFSWGYRLAARADYNNAFGSPFTLSPRFAFNHDVNGITPGPGGNFLEDRRSLTLGVEANYLNEWSVDVSYTRFSGAGIFNLVNDRDFVAFTARYSF